MTKRLPATDTQPWHRQFWPWFLIVLPASMVVASLYTYYIAERGADDLVAEDYYKNGLAINQQLEKQQRADALGISARLRFDDEEVHVEMTGPVGETELQLSLAHPLEADRDFCITLQRVAPGSYRGALAHHIAPHWYWTLEPQPQPPSGWRLEGTVQPEEIGHARRD